MEAAGDTGRQGEQAAGRSREDAAGVGGGEQVLAEAEEETAEGRTEKKKQQKLRVFFAVEFEDEVKSAIGRTMEALKTHEIVTAAKGGKTRLKWVEPESLHVTLKFLGHIQEDIVGPMCDALAQEIREAGDFEPFSITPGTAVRCFKGNPGPRSIWLSTDPACHSHLCRIHATVQKVCESFGFEEEKTSSFQPHITLCRLETQPKALTAAQKESLKRLGRWLTPRTRATTEATEEQSQQEGSKEREPRTVDQRGTQVGAGVGAESEEEENTRDVKGKREQDSQQVPLPPPVEPERWSQTVAHISLMLSELTPEGSKYTALRKLPFRL